MQDTDTLIIETINRYCTGELSDETDLYKMGLNSLKAIQLIVDLEEIFNISFEEDELAIFDVKTLMDFKKLVYSKIKK